MELSLGRRATGAAGHQRRPTRRGLASLVPRDRSEGPIRRRSARGRRSSRCLASCRGWLARSGTRAIPAARHRGSDGSRLEPAGRRTAHLRLDQPQWRARSDDGRLRVRAALPWDARRSAGLGGAVALAARPRLRARLQRRAPDADRRVCPRRGRCHWRQRFRARAAAHQRSGIRLTVGAARVDAGARGKRRAARADLDCEEPRPVARRIRGPGAIHRRSCRADPRRPPRSAARHAGGHRAGDGSVAFPRRRPHRRVASARFRGPDLQRMSCRRDVFVAGILSRESAPAHRAGRRRARPAVRVSPAVRVAPQGRSSRRAACGRGHRTSRRTHRDARSAGGRTALRGTADPCSG